MLAPVSDERAVRGRKDNLGEELSVELAKIREHGSSSAPGIDLPCDMRGAEP
jgi:hypothetical protein